ARAAGRRVRSAIAWKVAKIAITRTMIAAAKPAGKNQAGRAPASPSPTVAPAAKARITKGPAAQLAPGTARRSRAQTGPARAGEPKPHVRTCRQGDDHEGSGRAVGARHFAAVAGPDRRSESARSGGPCKLILSPEHSDEGYGSRSNADDDPAEQDHDAPGQVK